MTVAERLHRTQAADALCVQAFESVGCPDTGVALIAVGGYGRAELAPYSDLDVVLVHDDAVAPGEWAGQIWYPLWDSGFSIDHAVRSLPHVAQQASSDLRVALGMLDARHLAGDPNLTLRLRTTLLTQWRRDARERLPELQQMVRARTDRLGELAHSSVPDLKESLGGIRDATVLKALVATWLVDVPHADLERCRRSLLDVRDALHQVAGRATDRVAPELWPDLAEVLGVGVLGVAEPAAAQRHVRGLGRRITHISRLTWRRSEEVLREPPAGGPGRQGGPGRPGRGPGPALEPVAEGVAVAHGEVVASSSRRTADDPALMLRLAVEAAERRLVLPPATVARLARGSRPLEWTAATRGLFVRLLASGPGLLDVWETLDETGAMAVLLPEWEGVRLLPHASVVHRFTVDRHLVETCIEAAGLIRRVARPDVLMVASLLHDIGKGQLTEHCVAGEPIARTIAGRMGFDAREVDLVGRLVRWHLLLPATATTRDPDDPATVAAVTERIRDREELGLLAALTEADARATSDQAWTRWRAGLIRTLVDRVAAELAPDPAPAPSPTAYVEVPAHVLGSLDRVSVSVERIGDGARVTVISGDRLGLLADAAAMLALQRASVRSARAWTQGEVGVSVWEVGDVGDGGDQALEPAVLRQRLEAIVAGRVDTARRTRGPVALDPAVVVRPDASDQATVLEIRTADHPGVLHTVCVALAGVGVSVRSAHVATLGPQAVDVFYLQEPGAGALAETRAAEAAHTVRDALEAG